MFSFVRRRMYTSAIPLIIVLLGVFLLARLTGDPTSLYLPESATETQRAEFAAANGLDQPVWTQLIDYFNGVLHLDFGTSLRTGEPASTMALRAFPATLQLAVTTMVLAIILAVIIGCWAAYRPNSLADRFSSLLSMTAASIPDFWFAITGVWLFSVLMGWLPTSGTDAGLLSWILPIATLLIRPLGVLTQVVRGAMVSALSAPYVRLARSKGAGDLRVVTHHALRNAAAPALTVAGDLAVGLINGAVIVEAIFGWPGIGKLMIDAILQRDFAVLQAAVLLTAVSIFALNIIIDACYALLDARVREPAKV
ncbi:MAG: ABC transporter permease [Mycobacterium sp.]